MEEPMCKERKQVHTLQKTICKLIANSEESNINDLGLKK